MTGTHHLVCIPVDDGDLDQLADTLHSVLNRSVAAAGVRVVAAAESEAAAREVLSAAAFADSGVEMLTVTDDGDWLLAALRAVWATAGGRDVLLVRPGVRVPQDWDARLALTAARSPAVAAVSPLCEVSPFFSILDERRRGRFDVDTVDRTVCAFAARRGIEVPVALSNCVYLRGEALAAVFAEKGRDANAAESYFTLLENWRLNGRHLLLCDHVFVDDALAERRQEMGAIEQREDVQRIAQTHPLTGLRHTVNDALDQGMGLHLPAPRGKPVQLHVAHSWGGGLDRWVRDYCQADPWRTNLVLKSIGTWGAFGQRIALYHAGNLTTPLQYWELAYPIRATAVAHLEYQALLTEITDRYGVEVILVSSLIGHSLDVLTTALPTLLVSHDYYPFCPALNIFFGRVCTRCERDDLARCIEHNEHNRFFTNIPVEEWLAIRRGFIERVQAYDRHFAVPTESVSRHMRDLIPAFDATRFEIVPHGLALEVDAPLPVAKDAEKLRLVVLGSLAPNKGLNLLREALPKISQYAELHLLGCGEHGLEFQGLPGVQVVERYEREQLPAMLRDIAPHAGLLLSILPETFSYTLSELWTLGLPVVATRVGSFADRIDEGVSGFLYEPAPQALVEKVHWLSSHREALMAVAGRLQGFEHRTLEQMVADYQARTPLPTFSARRYLTRLPRLGEEAASRPAAIQVDPQARFIEVWQAFAQYVTNKLATTPRLHGWRKRLVVGMVRSVFRLGAALQRLAYGRRS